MNSGVSAQDLCTVGAQMLGEVGSSKFEVVSERPQKLTMRKIPQLEGGKNWGCPVGKEASSPLNLSPAAARASWGSGGGQPGHPTTTPCPFLDHVPMKQTDVF